VFIPLRQPAGRYGGAREMRPQPVTAAAPRPTPVAREWVVLIKPNPSRACWDSLSPSEGPERRSRDEMALKVEGVVSSSMHAEQALSGSSRFEPLHLALGA
jgi:hypothetical protein